DRAGHPGGPERLGRAPRLRPDPPRPAGRPFVRTHEPDLHRGPGPAGGGARGPRLPPRLDRPTRRPPPPTRPRPGPPPGPRRGATVRSAGGLREDRREGRVTHGTGTAPAPRS